MLKLDPTLAILRILRSFEEADHDQLKLLYMQGPQHVL
jgi:hypothetical protein